MAPVLEAKWREFQDSNPFIKKGRKLESSTGNFRFGLNRCKSNSISFIVHRPDLLLNFMTVVNVNSLFHSVSNQLALLVHLLSHFMTEY